MPRWRCGLPPPQAFVRGDLGVLGDLWAGCPVLGIEGQSHACLEEGGVAPARPAAAPPSRLLLFDLLSGAVLGFNGLAQTWLSLRPLGSLLLCRSEGQGGVAGSLRKVSGGWNQRSAGLAPAWSSQSFSSAPLSGRAPYLHTTGLRP